MNDVQNLNKDISPGEQRVFDNSLISTFLKCERLAYYEYILEIAPKSEGLAMKFGSAIHEALSVYYNSLKSMNWADKLSGIRNTEKAILDKMGLAFTKDLPPEQIQDKVYGIENGMNFLQWFLSQDNHPFTSILDVEIGFAIDIGGGFLYGGKIDKLSMHPQYNSLVVVDHKTTSRLSQNFISVLSLSRQFTGYILAANLYKDTGCHVAIAQIMTVKPTKTTGYTLTLVPITRTEEEINSFIKETRDFISRFLEYESKNFWPRSANCGAYWGACPYIHLCLQYHSRVPEIEEIDPSFVKKEPWRPWEECVNKWRA